MIAIELVKSELSSVRSRFNPFASAHEGIAIIQEEFEELKAEVFKPFHKRSSGRMEEEATQLAAMAVRFLTDLIK